MAYTNFRLAALRAIHLNLFTLMTFWSFSQQIIINTRGERIVVYPDGSWRYYERADSVLLNNNLLKEDVVNPEEKEDLPPAPPSVNPATDADISSLATRFGEQIATELINAKQTLARTVEDKFAAEARLDQAQENRKLIEPDILASLDEEYEALTQKVKVQRKHVQWMEKMHGKTQEMLTLQVQKKQEALNKLVAEYHAHTNADMLPGQDKSAMIATTKKSEEPKRNSAPTASNPRDSKAATMVIDKEYQPYARVTVPCILAQPTSGKTVAVQQQLLFTHTDEELRPYFRQQELVTCYASLMQIENNLYLSLEFQIASPDARKNFGILENNSMLRLKLINGAFVNLFNSHTDTGKIDAYTGNTVYTGYYPIDRESEKTLSKQELDKLRVIWSTGFEDYDIINLDFLINQFNCLRNE